MNFRTEGRHILAGLLLLHVMRGKKVLNFALIVGTDHKHRTTHGEPEYKFVFITTPVFCVFFGGAAV